MSTITIPQSFPNLPSSIQKIQKMFAANEINTAKLVSALQEEPLLCANILKLVNSPYYGLSTKVASISNAVALLGTTVIRGIIMASILKKSFALDLSPYKISIEQFDKICILRTRLLKECLKDEGLDIQALSSVAFLMESGKIITSNEILKNNLSSEFTQLIQNQSIIEAEESLFGANSYEVASLLFEQWQFEESFTKLISNIIKPITKEQKILHILSVVISVDGIFKEESITLGIKLLQEYGFDEKRFMKIVKSIELSE
jgi:HD-like signal output (HDOD) protein